MRILRLSLAAFLALGLVACDESAEKSSEPTETRTEKKAELPEEPTEEAKAAAELPEGTDEQLTILDRAKGHFLNNEFDAATKYFTRLVKTGPVSSAQVTAYIALGEIYREDGDAEKALKLYEELRKKAPNLPEVQFMTGRALAEQGETSKAIRAYEHAIKLQPDYLQAYVELGGLYTRAGREAEGQKIFLEYEKRVYSMAKTLENPKADPLEQVHVLEVFSFVQDDRATSAILVALSSPHPPVRERAVELAEEFQLGAATERLEKMAVQDPHLRVRMAARKAAETLTGAPVEGASPTFVDDPKKLPIDPEPAGSESTSNESE